MRNLPTIAALILLVFSTSAFRAADAPQILNGDFEQPAPSNPPPGWTMWGAQKFKTPDNFTPDSDRPHGGKSSFRIHHPANTAGYIVSAPESSLRPKTGMSYTVSFWARSDRPGQAIFGFDGYQQLKPFIGAAAPGLSPITVDNQWKQFQFTVDEGWDFFADECRYLLLVFKAAASDAEQRTLWIDDVSVIERPSARDGRLINPRTLRYPPLEHRLAEGKHLSITIDAGKRLAPANRAVGGVSFHRVAGWTKLPYDKNGNNTLPREFEASIRELHLPMTRFYALGDESFGLESAIDKAADLCTRIGVPLDAVPLEFEIQSARSKLPPREWSKGIRHSIAKGYAFNRWEIANEPYVAHPGRLFNSPDEYLEHFQSVSRAIKQVQPSAQILMPLWHRNPSWGNYLLKRAAGDYDCVAAHYYSFTNVHRTPFEDVVLTANYQLLDDIARINALLKAYNPQRDVYQYDTEWGMHSSGPDGEKADHVRRNGNIYGSMHRAVRLIHYLREGMLKGASTWEMFTYQKSPGFGFFAQDAPQLRSMSYWLYYHFNRHAGHWVLPIEGTAPYHTGNLNGQETRGPLTPAVATLSDDQRHLYLILANGSWKQPLPCQIDLRNFTPRQATGLILTSDDPDASPFIPRQEDIIHPLPLTRHETRLQFTLPPHAVVFVKINQ